MSSAKIAPALPSERPPTAETKEAPKADGLKMGKDAAATGDAAKTGKPKGAKTNLMLSSKHEPYADDSTTYKPRLNPEIRREYWNAIVAQMESRKPSGFRSWAQAYYTPDIVISDFPSPLVRIFYIVRSKFWDELYLNLLLIYLLLYVFIVDGYAAKYAPAVEANGDALLQLPLAFMFVTQLFSFLFTCLFICWCNDLVRFMARYNFGDWGFACVITCQFIEKYLYSGVGRADQAGQCAWIMKKFFSKKEDYVVDSSAESGLDRESKDIEEGSAGGGSAFMGADTLQALESQDNEDDNSFLLQSQAIPDSADKDADIMVVRPRTAEGKNDSNTGDKGPSRPGTSENKVRPGTSENKGEKSPSRPTTSGKSGEKPPDNRPGTAPEKKNSRPNTASKSVEGGEDDNTDGGGEDGEGNDDDEEDEEEEEDDGDEMSVLTAETAGSIGSKSKGGRSKGSKGSKGSKRARGRVAEKKKKKKKQKVIMVQWKCFVCLKENNKPRYHGPQADIYFGQKGDVYKRTYAIIKPRKDIPLCAKCFAPMDYKPPNATAKMFEHYPNRWEAFAQYPKKPPGNVQAGIGNDVVSISTAATKSFFFGLHDSINSGLMSNDWKLKKYVAGITPLMPRPVLKPGDFYEMSEIVECRLQKSDWARCKIIAVRDNHTYDIKYDPGDELRFVFEDQIRLPPEKHAYAYITEMSMVFLMIIMPLALLSSMLNSINQFVYPILLVSLGLLFYRIYRFITYFRAFFDGGCLKIFQMSLIYMLPLIFLFLACVVSGSSTEKGGSYESAVTLFALACASSLLPLYMMRPTFAVIGLIMFPQIIVGCYFVAKWLAGTPAVPTLGYSVIPLVTAILSAKYLRANLSAIWDVSLVMRPNANANGESTLLKIKNIIFDALGL